MKTPVMRTALLAALSGIALLAGSAVAAENDLGARVASQDGWTGWKVPIVAGAGMPCCFDWHHGRGHAEACDLESRNWNIGTNDDDPRPVTGGDLGVYVHVANGRIDKVRSYGSTCTIRNADKVRWLDPVVPADSVAFLAAAAATAEHDLADGEIASLALHADASATAALAKLGDASHPRKLREQALFWLAQARGAEGAKIVERVATSDADAELRENAVFALSQAHDYDGYASIRGIAQHDASEKVRGQALFWMAQMEDKRAKDDILAAIKGDASEHVREQGVFALSQLKDNAGESALIGIVRGDYPRKVKEQALFWLGQSGSTQAMDFLDELLTRSTAKTTVR
jgi:hypothetical protein